ncbi:M56 family metallopeptidase [Dyadobacter crusticola]|uniref:M56 family metallopeptidase n=1 Tax=Dyadobacter crusticola TaxID=292407 RepID=UPI0004E147DE|nr:M56 family metallopeptidase [Dyadobacter crusticola]
MNLEIVDTPFFTELIKAVCLTFLHSLWQGLVAAVLAGGLLMLTRKSRPVFRYNVLVALLGGLLLVNAATFFLILPKNQTEITGNVFISTATATEVNIAGTRSSFELNSLSSDLTDFCSRHASTILAIWLLVFLWKSARATAGLMHLKKLRKTGLHAPSNHWKDVFADLSRKLGITQRIQFLESECVSVPMVIGHLTPIVLVPLGMLAGMPAAQVEAILMHELAHIRRRDYLVNLIQIFCENIYFFNPALLWISYLIREEREHCCDDLAIEVMENKTSFVHALVSFQEYNLSVNLAQVAFAGKKNHLLNRIKRIINHNNKSLDAMEKVFVSVSLVAAIALSAAISPKSPASGRSVKDHQRIYSEPASALVPVQQPVAAMDTLPKKKKQESIQIHSANVYTPTEGVSTYDVHVGGKRYEIVKKNGKIVSLDVDGKEVPASEYGKYESDISKIESKIREEHKKAEIQRAKAEEMRAEAAVHRREAEKVRLEAEQSRAEADKHRQHAKAVQIEAEQNRANAEQLRKQADVMREQAEQLRKEADKLREQAEQNRKTAEVMRQAAEKTRGEYEKKQASLIDDLLKMGVIQDTKNLSYILSSSGFIVNGVEQPADIQRKIREKYLTEPGTEMVYNYKGRTGYTFSGTIHTREKQ